MVTTEMNRLSYEEPVATVLPWTSYSMMTTRGPAIGAQRARQRRGGRWCCRSPHRVPSGRHDHEVSGAIRGNDIEMRTPRRRRWCRNSGPVDQAGQTLLDDGEERVERRECRVLGIGHDLLLGC